MKKFIITLISLTLVFTMTNLASAATIESLVAGVGADTSRTVSVTVKYLSPEAAQESTLLVVKKGVSIVTAESSDLRYIAQKEVIGNTVTYSFKMAAADRTGTYDLYIGGTKIDAPKQTTISFDYNSATTINFVDKADTSVKIAASVLVNANTGDLIDLSVYAPDIIEYNGSLYRKDSSNPASYAVTATENAVDVLYAIDDIETIETVSATVIGSNLPVLPTTLNATTKGGTSTTVTVTEWDLSNLTEGEENTVYGTVWGSKLKAEAKVTVLPESFSLSDTSSKGKEDNNIYFPTNLADEFYIEFDMVINTVSDTGANFGYNGTKWGSGAFGISPNGGSLKATGGNKSGTSDGGTVLKSSVKAGETYRILIKADASTDTFTVYATGSDGAVGKAENKTFRKEQSPDCINTINFRGNNVTDGDLEIKNIKVHSKSYVKAKFVNSDGEVIKTAVGDVSGGGFTVEGKEIFAIHSDGTGAFYNIPEKNVTGHMTIPVNAVENKYAAAGDSFVNNGSLVNGVPLDNAEKGIRLMAAAASGTEGVEYAPGVNADGNTISSGGALYGSARAAVLQFEISEAMRNKAVMMNVYVDGYKPNASGTTTCYMAAYTIENPADTEGLSVKYSDAALTPTSKPIFALEKLTVNKNEIIPIDKYVAFDVSEAVLNALDKGETRITFKILLPHGGVYIADRDACTEGGEHEGKAAYLEIVSANKVTITADKVTKMGTDVTNDSGTYAVPVGATIKVYTTAPYVTDGTNVYTVENGKAATIESTTDQAEYKWAQLGVETIDGAQVRIGEGVDKDGKIPEAGGSGLRFITKVDGSDSIASVKNAAFGVEITAEGDTTNTVDIPTTDWQTAGSVFTSALTNLQVSNYNRKFTATPYVKIGTEKYKGAPVTRSIYQVAAGLLVNNSTDGTDYDQTALQSEVLYKVLNAYVNQTGIRLQINSGEGLDIYNKTDSTSNYSGDVFFEVTGTKYENNVYTITIKPIGGKTTINSYWKDYIRINNNNSKIADYTELKDNGDNTVTITFDYASYLAAQTPATTSAE